MSLARIEDALYQRLVRPVLFSFDPESVHERVLGVGGALTRFRPVRRLLGRHYHVSAPSLEVPFCGLRFKNPLGLAAGFDKNGVAVGLFEALGFGHIELGTITGEPQPGNPRPRIFRLVQDRALINRMGFPSWGCVQVAAGLAEMRRMSLDVILGVNIGKTKVVPVDQALEDYLKSFSVLKDLGDYFVLNVSSPNTPELRKLQEPGRLEQLFKGVSRENVAGKPLLVKIAPDLSLAEVDSIVEVAMACGVSGLIATNTTIARDGIITPTGESGGLSGVPLKTKSLQMVRHLYKRTSGQLPIIGVGGVSGASDVIAMIQAGASLVQIYTGFIYQGPRFASGLLSELAEFLEKQGLSSVSQLVGAAD